MVEQNKYILYGYLQFLWKKKWLIILVTIIGMGIGYAYTLTKTTTYTSKATVFTGKMENIDLSIKDIITNDYKHLLSKKVQNGFSVTIPANNLIYLTLVGSDKSIVESDLTIVANKYLEDLTEKYNVQYQARKNYVDALSKQVNATNDLMEYLLKENPDKISTDFLEEIFISDSQLVYIEGNYYNADTEELLFYAENELADMKKHEPRISGGIVTSENKPSALRYIVLGGAAFFQLMLIIVVLWKYIINARQFKEM
ncbi:Wzz/FepE/Etk N-terminal domain-containing protein [Fredinandcohnia salidurans]|uniref:Wzz/FepE/Etk N-terminal domain-containing protein n=1 Tax=Fredinandcohnia salidurans TaxID=2595041 RepID=A0ABW4MQ44_9BACI